MEYGLMWHTCGIIEDYRFRLCVVQVEVVQNGMAIGACRIHDSKSVFLSQIICLLSQLFTFSVSTDTG